MIDGADRRAAQVSRLQELRVLLVGAGGLGSPAAQALVRAGVRQLTVADDDVVDGSNLHRQTLYDDDDVGQPKAIIAARHLRDLAGTRSGGKTAKDTQGIVAREMRITPDTALDLINVHDFVLEGADNFATKFLVADACAISGTPVVQAGALRWDGWALATVPGKGPCLRCIFEDIPRGPTDSCATAGVIGPVVGVIGALQAALALRVLSGDPGVAGTLYSYRGLGGQLRTRRLQRNPECPLCRGEIRDLSRQRYVPPECAA